MTDEAPRGGDVIWARTFRLGLLATALGLVAAVVIHLLTPLPTTAIVVLVALAAFSASWRVVEHAAPRPSRRGHLVTTVPRPSQPRPRPSRLRLVPPA